MKKLFIYTFVLIILACSNNTIYAGKIKNLNINAQGNSTVTVKSEKPSDIEKVNIQKDPESKVIINVKEEDCPEIDPKTGICKPPESF